MAIGLLLPVSVDSPLQTEEGQNFTSLVPANQLQLASPSTARSDTSYIPDDNFVWSVARGEDGSFCFYATPSRTPGNQGVANQTAGAAAGEYVTAAYPWAKRNTRNAAAQYWFCANMLTPSARPSLSLFA
jgi:hypothetical protein